MFLMPEPLPPDLDPVDFWVCRKHDRWEMAGYPCLVCQDEWAAANPERVKQIERLARGAHRRTG